MAGGGEGVLVGLHVAVPVFAFTDVGIVEFPVLAGVVQPVLQALALLVDADVQVALDDRGAVGDQFGLGRAP